MNRNLSSWFTIFFLFGIVYYACDSEQESQEKVLLQNCGGCHIVPKPESLRAEIWETSILPRMADYFVWGGRSTFDYANKPFYAKKGRMPMTDTLWSEIKSYYLDNSNYDVDVRPDPELVNQEFFNVKQFNNLSDVPSVTALKLTKDNHFWSASKSQIIKSNLSGEIMNKIPSDLVPTFISEINDSLLMVLHSGQLRPHNQAFGSLLKINTNTKVQEELLAQLKRPVNLVEDENKILISEFGNVEGELTQITDEDFKNPKTLHSIPGCYKLFYFDLDNDGQKEYITQCTQALEGVYSISDQASSNSIRKLIAFPPEYGLSDLDTSDVNGDGLVDLLVALGDNADYSNMPKPFHGIRIYVNKGKKRFEEWYRYDWYGTTQARFVHANEDSNIDVIACSYFPVSDDNSIRLFINESQEEYPHFEILGFSESKLGRWMTMDKGDVDQDGDDDIIFGSFVEGPTSIDSGKTQFMLDQSVDALFFENMSNN